LNKITIDSVIRKQYSLSGKLIPIWNISGIPFLYDKSIHL